MYICSIKTHIFVIIYFLMNKVLIIVFTSKLLKNKNDSLLGFLKKTGGMIMSIIFSFRVQLFFIDKLLL